MSFHLYRPIYVWTGGLVHLLDATSPLSNRERAMLFRLKRATLISQTTLISGEIMSDDTSSALKLVTPPVSEPITLAQAKTFLRVEHTGDDEPITRAIAAARRQAESYLRVLLLPQTWEFSRANPCETRVDIPIGPAQSIMSVTVTNELGVTTTMDTGNYRLSVDGFSVLFKNTPQTEILKIRVSAGAYATVAEVPLPIVQGMLHHVAVMMETRDGSAALPLQSQSCYQPFRRVML